MYPNYASQQAAILKGLERTSMICRERSPLNTKPCPIVDGFILNPQVSWQRVTLRNIHGTFAGHPRPSPDHPQTNASLGMEGRMLLEDLLKQSFHLHPSIGGSGLMIASAAIAEKAMVGFGVAKDLVGDVMRR